jgi:hypothetical protein
MTTSPINIVVRPTGECIGFIRRHAKGFDGYTAAARPLGTFESEKAALAAVLNQHEGRAP